ncbi:hypothetical protein NE237_028972 [Protea cynaroides]|uniref:L10-interacting MYB domain-containing protein n=1 Tax=Protea cynaroides TaxID=273540 RepID=A0A9Q0GRD7_9MAGN|nr:hypothetical protein NE237_028972 [Protea cynaroides]
MRTRFTSFVGAKNYIKRGLSLMQYIKNESFSPVRTKFQRARFHLPFQVSSLNNRGMEQQMEPSKVQSEVSLDQNDEVEKSEPSIVLQELLLASNEQSQKVDQVKSDNNSVLPDEGRLQNGCTLETFSTGMGQEMGPFNLQQEALLTNDEKNDIVEQAGSEGNTLMPDQGSLQNDCTPESMIGIKQEIEPSIAQHEVFLACDNQNNEVEQFGNEVVDTLIPEGSLMDGCTLESKIEMEPQVESAVQPEVLLQTDVQNDKDELVGSADNTMIPDEGSWPNDYSLESRTEGKDNQGPPSSDRLRTIWTPAMNRYFIDIMLEQVRRGYKIRNTFHRKAWEDMVASFNRKFVGLQVDKEILRNRSKKLRLQHNALKTLLDQNGFHWDETRKMVTADDRVWNEYLKAHPEVQPYRRKSFPNYVDLCAIFGSETADGRYEGSGQDVKTTYNTPVMKTGVATKSMHSAAISSGHKDQCVVRSSQFVDGMDTQFPTSSERSRTNWTPTMDRYFIDIMIEQVHKGYKNGNIFRKKAWEDMVALFNTKFGFQLDKEVLRNRHKKLRLQYNAIKTLLDHDGFCWDETRQMVTAEDKVWDDYLKIHPEARSYRTKTLLNYNDLCIIYGNETANGTVNRLLHDVRVDGSPAVKIAGAPGGSQSLAVSAAHGDPGVVRSSQFEGMDDQDPPTNDRLKTNWTPPMDRYFIELMMDQVNRGHKVGNAFRKEAWAEMLALFNTKVGMELDKEALRNRYRKLRMQYNALKTLLDHGGFRWDETRQMVTADDNVWDDYLKAHPEARSYRTKTVPNYNDLCVIYGHPITDGRQSCSGHDVDLEDMPGMEIEVWEEPISPIFVGHGDPLTDMQESSSQSDEAVDISNQQNKRPYALPSTLEHSRKMQRSSDQSMVDALREMAIAVTSLANKKENDSPNTLENVVNALKAIPDMDEDLFLDACDLLEDEQKAKMFLALDATIRKKWLMRKLRP